MIIFIGLILFIGFIALLCSGGNTPASPTMKKYDSVHYNSYSSNDLKYLREQLMKNYNKK